MNRIIKKIWFLVAGLVIIFCAKQMPPPGGPIDTLPPEVIHIEPNPGATYVASDGTIAITFSEPMNQKSVEEAIFISPLPSGQVFYKWKRKSLTIEFGDTLKRDRTYVLTIGTKSSDLRNNKMKDSFSIAFSTGDHIDEGQISGHVYAQAGVEGTLVSAYSLTDSMDVDPTKVLADYYTQCNQQGGYQLLYVAPGKYRLFAIRDRDGNRKYTRSVDALGVTISDVNLTADEKFISDVNFQMTVEDTIQPLIKSVYTIDQKNIIVRFNEPIAEFDENEPQKYFEIVTDNRPDTVLNILSGYANSLDPSNIHLTTEKQSATSYKLTAKNLFDRANNPLDSTANFALFAGNIEPDTMKPIIVSKSIEDSSVGVKLDQEIRFAFSEAMDQGSFENSFVVTENDTNIVSGSFNWKNPADVYFLPDSALKSLTSYVIALKIDSIVDRSGNSLADSLDTLYFRTLNADTLSSIGGEIIDLDERERDRIFLTAKSEQHSYKVVLDEPGAYRFENILPGIYLINGFRDADSNGVYSFGQAMPFVPAERFFYYPDSIKVRSRWPNEGNDIVFQ